jgi:hypothetical protein
MCRRRLMRSPDRHDAKPIAYRGHSRTVSLDQPLGSPARGLVGAGRIVGLLRERLLDL